MRLFPNVASWQELPPQPPGTLLLSESFPHYACVTFTILSSQQGPCACELFGSFASGTVKYSLHPRFDLAFAIAYSPWAIRYSMTSRTAASTCCEAAGYWSHRTETSVRGSKSSTWHKYSSVLIFLQRSAGKAIQNVTPRLRPRGTQCPAYAPPASQLTCTSATCAPVTLERMAPKIPNSQKPLSL